MAAEDRQRNQRIDWGRATIAALVVSAVGWIQFRYVLTHFSNGGHLLDSGWFASLLGSGDPLLTNPRAIDGLSYFAYHLTPWLSGVGMAAHAAGIDGFLALAIHQGAMFALLTAALIALALREAGWPGFLLGLAAIFLMTIGDLTLQIASYPHYEIAIVAFAALGLAFGRNGRPVLATLAFLLATLVREDGGLYAAVFIAVLAAVSGRRAVLFGAIPAIAASAAMFWIKAKHFPGFSAFAYNYSGDNWQHLTADFVTGRLADFVHNPLAVTTLLAALALAIQSRRYLVAPLLLLPLIAAQLLAVRPQLGHFTLYYALPFLVIWVALFAGAGRTGTRRHPTLEALIVLAGILVTSGPVQFILSPPSYFPVFAAALVRPVVDLPALARAAEAALIPDACVSKGVAALIPNAVTPSQVIDPTSDLAACRTIFLFNGDLDYDDLAPKMADRVAGPVIAGRIERYDQRP